MKQIIAVQHKDEVREGICPICGERMTWRDMGESNSISAGNLDQKDLGGFWEHKCPFNCPECGSPERRETDVEKRGVYLEYHYVCIECDHVWTIRENKEE